MSYDSWQALNLFAYIIFFSSIFMMIFFSSTKNRYYHSYHEDELIKKSKTVNSINYLYFTDGETHRYIKKYVLCHTTRDKYVIAKFNEGYKYISFFVLCYKKGNKPFRVIKYYESNTDLNSKVISVPFGTKRVNVVISQVDNKVLNHNAILPLSKSKIKANAFLMFLLTFSFLFLVRNAIFELSAYGFDLATKVSEAQFKSTMINLLGTYENYGIIALSFLVALLVGSKAKRSYKKKSKKVVNGGAIEYDFSE